MVTSHGNWYHEDLWAASYLDVAETESESWFAQDDRDVLVETIFGRRWVMQLVKHVQDAVAEATDFVLVDGNCFLRSTLT